MEDTRRFTRLPVTLNAFLTLDETTIDGEVHDISLNGALLLCLNTEVPAQSLNETGILTLELNEGEVVLTMSSRIVYIDDHYVGLEFKEIGIESACHLRRLVELNLGSEDILHRELSLLWDHRK